MEKTIVCHCEDISLEELYSALEQGYNEIESIKRFTGIGTGKCQGKCCVIQTLRELDNEAGQAAISEGNDKGPGSTLPGSPPRENSERLRLPTIRQPVKPIKIDDIRKPENTNRNDTPGGSNEGP